MVSRDAVVNLITYDGFLGSALVSFSFTSVLSSAAIRQRKTTVVVVIPVH